MWVLWQLGQSSISTKITLRLSWAALPDLSNATIDTSFDKHSSRNCIDHPADFESIQICQHMTASQFSVQLSFSHQLETLVRKLPNCRGVLDETEFRSSSIRLFSVCASDRVSRPDFSSLGLGLGLGLGLECLRSHLALEGFRSRSRALSLETLHELFFMKSLQEAAP